MMTNRLTRRARRGAILVATIWVIIILGGLVLVFARSMRVEAIASSNRLSAEQASAVERGGEQYVLSVIDTDAGDTQTILDSDAQALQVGNGYFWIIRPNTDPDTESEQIFDYGIVDEGSKLNLNTAAETELAALPGMTDDVADSIVDWRDSDENVTDQGAESSYYNQLNDPYMAKNGLFESVDELVLVKGITDGDLLYGYDENQNGVIDDREQTAEGAGGDAAMFNEANGAARGIWPFVTVWGTSPNTDASGQARVNVNTASSDALSEALTNDGLSSQSISAAMGSLRTGRPFKNVFDFAAKTGMKPDDLKLCIDSLTTSDAKTLSGLVNVNTAPREVLMCLPGLDQSDADALVNARQSADANSIDWVAGALTPQKATGIGSRITGRSSQYSADIVAVSGDGRAFSRVRIVVDARQSPPKIVYRKDLTSLGWPLTEDIRVNLRNGLGAQGISTNGIQVRAASR